MLAALTVASIGLIGQTALKTREEEITKRIAKQEDTRLYTELMSRREQADAGLRTEMFKAILTDFLKLPGGDGDEARTLSSELLKLEMLALNFGDSLSLAPLFLEMNRRINRPFLDIPQSKQELFQKRLRSLARRVSGGQLSSLVHEENSFTIRIPLDEISGGKSYLWPAKILDDLNEVRSMTEAQLASEEERVSTRTFGGITRRYEIAFSNVNDDLATVDVKLTITYPNLSAPPQKMNFELNFFNFPMIDSTRLSHDQRFALVLEKFGKVIVVTGVCFPGAQAGLRDKAFIADVLERMKTPGENEAEPNQ